MRVLLVHPRFPVTYWGFQHGLRVIGKRASLPPLGLMTLAASLPSEWELRLIDLNVRALTDRELAWADAVFTGGMLLQSDSAVDVVRRARSAGRYVAVGGPAPTTTPELFAEADLVFRGEAEGRIGDLVEAVEARRVGTLEPAPREYPDITRAPVPRFELLDVDAYAYASMSIQSSRGCPYRCEFCDVIEIFGRRPRVKSPAQVVSELEALWRTGYRGTVFFVDDNFIGNRRAIEEMLPAIRDWQIRRGRPFELYTEASVNLASHPDLTAAMVEAGFSAVFLGIETPSMDALRAARKHQNLKLDLTVAVETLTRAGLEVMGGFIVGFDDDGPECFEVQRDFILPSPMPLAMVGVLTALPGTALWKRLSSEGRLRERSGGDQFGRPNFDPRMDELELVRGYRDLMRDLYAPEAYYRRCLRHVEIAGPRPSGPDATREIGAGVRILARLGPSARHRPHLWRLLAAASRRGTTSLRWAFAHAVQGEHLIRYTEEDVVPRMDRAASEVPGRPRRPAPRRVPLPVVHGPVLPDRA